MIVNSRIARLQIHVIIVIVIVIVRRRLRIGVGRTDARAHHRLLLVVIAEPIGSHGNRGGGSSPSCVVGHALRGRGSEAVQTDVDVETDAQDVGDAVRTGPRRRSARRHRTVRLFIRSSSIRIDLI